MKSDPTKQMAARLQAKAYDPPKACFPELSNRVNTSLMLFIVQELQKLALRLFYRDDT